MKLFLKQDKQEGEMYPQDVFLSWGYFWPTIDKKWYVRLELPITFTQTVYDPMDFHPRTGKARPVFGLRTIKSRRWPIFTRTWKLIEIREGV